MTEHRERRVGRTPTAARAGDRAHRDEPPAPPEPPELPELGEPAEPAEPAEPVEPADRGVAFHRLATLRPGWRRWWRPVLSVVTALLAYTVLASLLLIVTVLALTAAGADPALGRRLGDPTSPLDVFLTCAFAAVAGPAALIGARVGGWRPAGFLWSVTGGIRRPVLIRSGMIATAVMGLLAVVQVATAHGGTPPPVARASAVLVLLVALAPLAAAGEELAFRGLGQQAIGTWLRHPAWAILLPLPFSLLGRGGDTRDLAGAMLLGLCCGLLAWRSGGLERAIALHAAALVATGVIALLGGDGSLAHPLTAGGIIGLTVAGWWSTGRRAGIGPLEPVIRPAGAPVPAPVRV